KLRSAKGFRQERAMGFEPTTSSLGSHNSGARDGSLTHNVSTTYSILWACLRHCKPIPNIAENCGKKRNRGSYGEEWGRPAYPTLREGAYRLAPGRLGSQPVGFSRVTSGSERLEETTAARLLRRLLRGGQSLGVPQEPLEIALLRGLTV